MGIRVGVGQDPFTIILVKSSRPRHWDIVRSKPLWQDAPVLYAKLVMEHHETFSAWFRYIAYFSLGSFFKLVATFNHVGGFFYFVWHRRGCLNDPSFRIGYYMLHVENDSCVITNCGQHMWGHLIHNPVTIYDFVIHSLSDDHCENLLVIKIVP